LRFFFKKVDYKLQSDQSLNKKKKIRSNNPICWGTREQFKGLFSNYPEYLGWSFFIQAKFNKNWKKPTTSQASSTHLLQRFDIYELICNGQKLFILVDDLTSF